MSLDASHEPQSFSYVFSVSWYFEGLLTCAVHLDSSLEEWILELIEEMHLHLHLECLFLCIVISWYSSNFLGSFCQLEQTNLLYFVFFLLGYGRTSRILW
jgi:hypothetical protein